ncbi:amidohydrolase [Oceanobacillus caeni]|uniref:amidohydrolase n=1 Tax=Oceanobacillus TaxID=182709 RepID=UPI0006217B55|nr:amidohydrolase [Oceanobacillus caeni]KKE80323.1 amidohydrolase [Bacilli bacterium VT-13-104]PZD81497.1 amidohydrolase [Bacilli bacterium]MBU8792098.1 amidohydrolase [Oceanobacillus caeni]MCR1835464.1 amidohydrolase [Oceanobacillus caeni]PZD83520.1 amidohydrolase [Bacilli bacterium]
MKDELMKMLEEREDEMIKIRRYLHEHPELSFKEEKTAAYIADFYKGKDVEIETNVGNGYGIIVTIEGASEGKTIGLRADFDALPITEKADVPFRSKNEGVMHACGHDAHTAYLLILADCLIQLKDQIKGTIKIIHQHAEEQPPGGAKSIMESGKLNDVDAIFGIHILPVAPAGTVGYHSGYSFNGRTYFKLKIQGKGGHGSSPDKANDAIVAGSYFVTAVQTVVSRRVNPMEAGVVTIGSFDGKGSFNIIKDSIELEGDVRYSNDETREVIDKEFKRIVKGLEELFDVTCELTYTPDYPPLYNDPELTSFVADTLNGIQDSDIKEVKEFPKLSPSDDFAYYLEKIPGSYFYIGCTPKGVQQPYFNHHPKFDIDEDAMLVAAKSVGHIVCHFLDKE